MLSNTCKYGIRACIYMAVYGKDKLLNIKEIAKGLDVPEPFLGKILQTLAKKKILTSQRGISGGFKFARDPCKVSFLEIVEVIDGLDVFHECILGVRICTSTPEHAKDCPFHTKLDPLLLKLYKVFKENSVGDFADKLEDFRDFVLI
ncbi:MAG: Rrf2 family transcriptional regulator [Bacteroidales bacterium]|nr:Rrf2 family transcriptional regulator [Bacteroidales bacterium]